MPHHSIPENLNSLHRHEELIRASNLGHISGRAELMLHLRAIEAAMSAIYHFALDWESTEQDELTIQLLGLRLFNGAAAAMKLLLSGYYQTAAAQLRDLLETAFLVDYLSTDAALVALWRTASRSKRRELFRPEAVRDSLDERDGFKDKKRAEQYRTLSNFAAHPAPEGFRMLRPGPNELALIGPFHDPTAIKALLEEFVKIVLPSGAYFVRHFQPRSRADFLAQIGFLSAQGDWLEHALGRPFDRQQIRELEKLLLLVPN